MLEAHSMRRVEINELPDRLLASINVKKFLFAYFLPDRARYIARHVTLDGRSEELEYDVGSGRLLTIDERRQELPGDTSAVLADDQLLVTLHYSFDQDPTKLCVMLDVRDEAGNPLVCVTKQVFDPTPWDLAVVVRDAVREARLPATYAAWPIEQRIGYWATTLHRFRRALGEAGQDEDDLYTPELLRDMERLDPHVRDLLPDILALAGALEQTAPEEAVAAFTRRIGALDPRGGDRD